MQTVVFWKQFLFGKQIWNIVASANETFFFGYVYTCAVGTKTESDAIRMWIRFFHVWPDATMAKACAGPLRAVSIINVYITLTR